MHKQFIRYTIVGLGSNAILYLIYLLLTGIGLGHKSAMTLLYGIGILQTFLLNRRWTFDHEGKIHSAFVRYIIVYLTGYLVNLTALYIFVDLFGFAHQVIQGVMILFLAVLLFAMQRIWVFSKQDKAAEYMPR